MFTSVDPSLWWYAWNHLFSHTLSFRRLVRTTLYYTFESFASVASCPLYGQITQLSMVSTESMIACKTRLWNLLELSHKLPRVQTRRREKVFWYYWMLSLYWDIFLLRLNSRKLSTKIPCQEMGVGRRLGNSSP